MSKLGCTLQVPVKQQTRHHKSPRLGFRVSLFQASRHPRLRYLMTAAEVSTTAGATYPRSSAFSRRRYSSLSPIQGFRFGDPRRFRV